MDRTSTESKRRLQPLAACLVIFANIAVVGLFHAWGELIAVVDVGIAPASVALPAALNAQRLPMALARGSWDTFPELVEPIGELARSHRARPPRFR